MSALTDRELLELAAKAAGVDAEWLDQSSIDNDAATCGLWLKGARNPDNSQYWNPLTDDGDALRLAVKLGIHLTNSVTDAWATTFKVTSIEPLGSDPCAATRRAIVRAAALTQGA